MPQREAHAQKIHFNLTKDDFWHLQLHAYARKRPRQIRALIFYGAMVIIASLALKSILFVVGGAAFAVLLFALAYLSMWLNAAKSAQALQNRGEHIITLSPEGVHQKNNQTDGLTRWNAVKAITTDANTIFLQLDNPGRVYIAIIVPKRAFENEAAIASFTETARSYQQAAQK
ncbi:MAG TPA: YcxB family protein [Candidatus Saccharimonadales bacterium]|nr:YcxB family protein [Candidatus Saccharimonadales bacterium]